MRRSVILLLVFLVSCRLGPNLGLIGKDLGVAVPKKFKLLKADSDPFGLGADMDQTFVLQFDSANGRQLEKEIIHTPLYNCADVNDFDKLSMKRKLEILKKISDARLTSYWVKSGSTYWFDGDSLFLNTHDDVRAQLYLNNIVLPNSDTSQTSGTPVYTVRARFDTRSGVLYYRYIHI